VTRPSQSHGDCRCYADPATGVRVVAPHGEIDLRNAPELQAAIDELIDDGFRQLVVDLSGVSFIDSSGVRALLVARRRLDRTGDFWAVTCRNPNMRRVLELLGVADNLNVASSRLEALRRFA
jgi:anti-anti-sigma factor